MTTLNEVASLNERLQACQAEIETKYQCLADVRANNVSNLRLHTQLQDILNLLNQSQHLNTDQRLLKIKVEILEDLLNYWHGYSENLKDWQQLLFVKIGLKSNDFTIFMLILGVFISLSLLIATTSFMFASSFSALSIGLFVGHLLTGGFYPLGLNYLSFIPSIQNFFCYQEEPYEISALAEEVKILKTQIDHSPYAPRFFSNHHNSTLPDNLILPPVENNMRPIPLTN